MEYLKMRLCLECVDGWPGDGNTCVPCGKGFTFASNSGANSCSTCDLCDGDGESVGTECTPWANTICCNLIYSVDSLQTETIMS